MKTKQPRPIHLTLLAAFALLAFAFQNCSSEGIETSANSEEIVEVEEEEETDTSTGSSYLTILTTTGNYSVYEEDDVQITVTHDHEEVDNFIWYRVDSDGTENYLQSSQLSYIILSDLYTEDSGTYRVYLQNDGLTIDSMDGYITVYVENLIGDCSYDIDGTKFTAFSDIGGKNNVSSSDQDTYNSLSTYEENWFRIAHCLMAKTDFGAKEGKVQVNSHACEVESAKHGYNTGLSELSAKEYHDTWHLKVRCGENTISYSWYSCHQSYDSSSDNFSNYAYQVYCHIVGY